MMKRITALLLAVIMTAGLCGMNAIAAEPETAEVNNVETEIYPEVDLSSHTLENMLREGGLLPDDESALNPDSGIAAASDDGESAAAYDTAHYAEVVAAVTNRQTELDISDWGFTTADIETERFAVPLLSVFYKHPEFFYLTGLGYSADSDGNIISYTFKYSYSTEEEIAAFNSALANAKAELNSQITDDMTTLEKALVIHDYIVATTAYDYADYLADEDNMPDSVYNMYGVLVNHSAVCAGYADAFEYFANYYGINCEYVSSRKANHAWNVIELENGNWYHLDATWDDPVWDQYGRVKHKYFLLSSDSLVNDNSKKSDFSVESATLSTLMQLYPDMMSDEFKAELNNSFTSSTVKASDTSYESGQFWSATTARTYHDTANDLWYYMDGNGNLRSYNYDTASSTVLTTADKKWYVWDDASSYYSGYNKLYGEGSTLYYTTSTAIYVYNIDAGQQHVYYTPDTSEGYIYGFGCTDGVMGYTLHTSPSISSDETILPIDGCNAPDDVHVYDAGTVTQDATCGCDGVTAYTCTICGETKNETIPMTGNHSWDDGTVTTQPTTTSEGEKTYTCTVCGTTKTESIARLHAVPQVSVSVAQGSASKKVVMTGKVDNLSDTEGVIIGHGLVYITAARLGYKTLSLNTSGRTKVTFGAYKTDGSYSYTITAASKTTRYVVRAWATYTDDSGNSVTVYSDPVTFTYNTAK